LSAYERNIIAITISNDIQQKQPAVKKTQQFQSTPTILQNKPTKPIFFYLN
jgi:hypothetical protein